MDNFTQQGEQEIIEALGISASSPELQAKVIASFGKILFKRLLLLLPDAVAKDVIAEITALSLPEGMQRLIPLLDLHVPDAGARKSEVLEATIAEFRLL
ncbi:MAG: hypothetical protein A2762_04995 [Candidatus Lloydbacteria bacterium RIFCSPHIGHO2_01_FULL_54_11]|nr:MAG: hypothetical protein A2762_04995 [Candidatus Lloydbacteria bacterium RIFCSPHIGHO2_01_FULL_54_11]OGZ16386.1 MAG: hypothetical protein A3H76_03320 [Candidatus Lloydbacteria bacterium RIFCSPLOWO2_02_FULL_54_12]